VGERKTEKGKAMQSSSDFSPWEQPHYVASYQAVIWHKKKRVQWNRTERMLIFYNNNNTNNNNDKGTHVNRLWKLKRHTYSFRSVWMKPSLYPPGSLDLKWHGQSNGLFLCKWADLGQNKLQRGWDFTVQIKSLARQDYPPSN